VDVSTTDSPASAGAPPASVASERCLTWSAPRRWSGCPPGPR
jgi:hypothetical protein